MSENQEAVKTEEAKPVPAYRYVVSVRFKNSRKAYSFGTNDEMLEYGDYVVVETVSRWARSSAICATCRCTPRICR